MLCGTFYDDVEVRKESLHRLAQFVLALVVQELVCCVELFYDGVELRKELLQRHALFVLALVIQ